MLQAKVPRAKVFIRMPQWSRWAGEVCEQCRELGCLCEQKNQSCQFSSGTDQGPAQIKTVPSEKKHPAQLRTKGLTFCIEMHSIMVAFNCIVNVPLVWTAMISQGSWAHGSSLSGL
jgi:hypothetical protein